jgi:hypothetical protein
MATPTIKAKLVLETSGGGGLSGFASGGGSGGGGAGGLAGVAGGAGGKGVLGTLGKMAGWLAVAAGALTVIKKFMAKVVESSPRLQATLSIFGKGIQLLLRPIGDVMSFFLKPFAIQFLRWALPFYKKASQFTKPVGEGAAAGAKVGGALGGYTGALVGTGVGGALGGLGELLGVDIIGKLGEWKDAITNWFATIDWAALWETMVTFFTETIPTFFTETLPEAFNTVVEVMTKFFLEDLPFAAGYAFESVIIFFTETFPKAVSNFVDTVVEFFTETIPKAFDTFVKIMIAFFTVTLPTAIIDAWETIKTFFTSTVPGWIKTGFERLKTFLLNDIPSWVSGMIDKIQNTFSSVGSFFRKGRKKAKDDSADDAMITKDGKVIKLNPSDNIMAFQGRAPGGVGGGANITVNINALDASSINRSLIDNITRQITENLKRELQGRSSYGVGI